MKCEVCGKEIYMPIPISDGMIVIGSEEICKTCLYIKQKKEEQNKYCSKRIIKD